MGRRRLFVNAATWEWFWWRLGKAIADDLRKREIEDRAQAIIRDMERRSAWRQEWRIAWRQIGNVHRMEIARPDQYAEVRAYLMEPDCWLPDGSIRVPTVERAVMIVNALQGKG